MRSQALVTMLASLSLLAACRSADPAPSTEEPEPGEKADASTGPTKKDAGSKPGAGGSGGAGEGGMIGSGGTPAGSGGTAGSGGAGGDPDEPPPPPDGGAEGGAGGSDQGGSGAGGAPTGSGGSTTGPDIPGCTLRWSPSAMRDYDKAFEAAEMPDIQFPGGSPGTHQGVKHLTAVAEHDAYRIDSHYNPPSPVDYDRVTQTGPMRNDRLRCETRGMVDAAGKEVDLLNGQTWRLTWSLYIPKTLQGTGRFTHIMQMKYVDKGGGASGSPIVTVTLRSGDKMEVLFWIGGGSLGTVDISGLHDRWLSADMTLKIGTAGSLHWVLKDGAKVVVDKTQNGTTWPSDGARLRPKWGIYRGITSGVQTTYLMVSDLRAYQCQ